MTTTGMFMFGAEVLFHCWADKPIFFIAWRYASPRPMFFFLVSFVTWLFTCRSRQALSKQDRSAGETRWIMYQLRPDRWKWNETPTFFTAYSYSLTTSVHSLFGAYVFFFGTPNAKIIGFPNQMTTHLTCKGFIASLLDLLDAYTVETLVANGPLNNTAKKGVWLCVLS